MRSSRRGGFSLLEVIIALGILLGSAVVLAELASIGRHHILSAEEKSTAQLECQTKLNELLAGTVPLEAVQNVPLRDDSAQPEDAMQDSIMSDTVMQDATMPNDPLSDPAEWVYSVDIEPITGPNQPPGMARVRVTVAHNLPEEEHPKQFTLTHWVRGVNLSSLGPATSQPSSDPMFDELSTEPTNGLPDELMTESIDDLFDPSFDGGLP